MKNETTSRNQEAKGETMNITTKTEINKTFLTLAAKAQELIEAFGPKSKHTRLANEALLTFASLFQTKLNETNYGLFLHIKPAPMKAAGYNVTAARYEEKILVQAEDNGFFVI